MQNKFKIKSILATILPLVGFLFFGGISAESAFAYSASLTTSNDISLDAVMSEDGTSIHSESINVQTDCRAGYNLTIATPEGSDLYKYDNGTQSSNTASFTAVDGTSALNSNNNTNKWGYTLTTNPSGSTVFSPLSSTESVLKTSSQTASPTSDINDTFNINYGVKVDRSMGVGSYKMANNGTIVYYLTMDATCTQYTVNFNANGGTGTIANQNIQIGEPTRLTSADSLTAPTGGSYTDAGNNTITGDPDKLWTFWGWNTAIDGSGDWYKDREKVQDLTNVGSTITLYAQWKQATLADMTTSTPSGTEKVIDHNTMQDMSPAVCYNSDKFTAIGAPYGQATLTDDRDGITRTYTVAKLPDSLCWMTQNLNLGTSTAVTLTPDDTDITENFTLPASDPNDFSTSNTSSNTNKATVFNDVIIPDYTVNSTVYAGKVNAYYSYAAATANTNIVSVGSATIKTSICPRNWDLPLPGQFYNLRTVGSIATYNNTNASYAGKNAGNEPYYFIYGGYRRAAGSTINTTNFNNLTSYGYLWSSASYSGAQAYGTSVYSYGLYSGNSGEVRQKYYGLSIRCVASNGKVTVNYDGNGTTEYPVTGSVAAQTNVEINSTNAQQGTGFTRTGWAFNGWNTAADGSGTSIAAGASIANLNLIPGSTITLYAQWTPQYTINYVHNCKTWAPNDANCTDDKSISTLNQKINLDASGNGSGTLKNYNAWTNLSGWKIKEWTTNADGTGTAYPVKSTYSVTGANPDDSITLYAHWVPIYTVQYDGNGADNSSTGMGSTDPSTGIKTVNHTNVVEGDTFDLFASNFKRTGYGFVGWSTDSNAWSKLTDNDTTNDAKIWGPNEIITAPAYNGTPITTLYAIWAPAETDGGNPVYLQNWTGCSAMTATAYDTATGKLTVSKNSITALTDERDGNVYTIAKLADENCWIVENLRLADTHEENGNVVATTLTTSNTNISTANNTLPITNIYNADSSLATKSNSLSPSSSVAYNASSAPYGWCSTYTADCTDQSRLNTTNSTWNNNTASAVTPSVTQNINSGLPHAGFDNYVYSYGNYYNWYSATAGYGTYSRTTTQPTDGDLCPAGWKLPYGGTGTSGSNIGGTKGGFYYLANQMGETSSNLANSNKFRSFPNNFIYSGIWYKGWADTRGNNGMYLSASAHDTNGAYILKIETSRAYPGSSGGGKDAGFPVRCVSGL